MNTTSTMLLGMLFHEGACIFEELFETRTERAEALIEVMRSNYDQVSEAELAEVRNDPDHAEDPDEMVNAVHQEYSRYERQLDLHLGELEVPGASRPRREWSHDRAEDV